MLPKILSWQLDFLKICVLQFYVIFKIIYEFSCVNPISRAYRTYMCTSVYRTIGIRAILKIVVGMGYNSVKQIHPVEVL
jgi:hypothetical protein